MVSEDGGADVRLSLDNRSSSPTHCRADAQTVSIDQPASPVFNTSLAAESHCYLPFSQSRHSPVAADNQPQSAMFSPPTDMDTDVSAIIGQAAEDSALWKSDISFEVESTAQSNELQY